MNQQGNDNNNMLSIIDEMYRNSIIKIEDKSLITVSTASELVKEASQMKDLTPLYAPFFYEDECAILFADTNVGKSILSVQIADEISRKGYSVLYLDFEMSLRQFASRCRNEQGKVYQFHANFMRGSINLNTLAECEKSSYEEELIACIENRIEVFQPQVVIIDNLTYLCVQSESGTEAGQLMRKLMEIKNRYNVSMLVISHTPKRNLSDALTENSLAGSKRIANFADSIFAIGRSTKGENVRYIKQIKSRSGELVHGASNVQVCHIDYVDGLLRFVVDGEDVEANHLKRNNNHSNNYDEQIMELLQEGKTVRDICAQLSVGSHRVIRVRNSMDLSQKQAQPQESILNASDVYECYP